MGVPINNIEPIPRAISSIRYLAYSRVLSRKALDKERMSIKARYDC